MDARCALLRHLASISGSCVLISGHESRTWFPCRWSSGSRTEQCNRCAHRSGELRSLCQEHQSAVRHQIELRLAPSQPGLVKQTDGVTQTYEQIPQSVFRRTGSHGWRRLGSASDDSLYLLLMIRKTPHFNHDLSTSNSNRDFSVPTAKLLMKSACCAPFSAPVERRQPWDGATLNQKCFLPPPIANGPAQSHRTFRRVKLVIFACQDKLDICMESGNEAFFTLSGTRQLFRDATRDARSVKQPGAAAVSEPLIGVGLKCCGRDVVQCSKRSAQSDKKRE